MRIYALVAILVLVVTATAVFAYVQERSQRAARELALDYHQGVITKVYMIERRAMKAQQIANGIGPDTPETSKADMFRGIRTSLLDMARAFRSLNDHHERFHAYGQHGLLERMSRQLEGIESLQSGGFRWDNPVSLQQVGLLGSFLASVHQFFRIHNINHEARIARQAQEATRNMQYVAFTAGGLLLIGMIIVVWVIRSIDETLARQKSTEEELFASGTQLKTIADTLPAAIALIDTDFKYRFVNKPTADWFNNPVEAFKGRHVSEMMPEGLFERVEGEMKNALAGERISVERTTPHRHGFGADHIASVNYVPYRDENGDITGFLSMVEDITERRAAEHAMREQEAQLAGVMDHAADGIVTIDTEGSIESFNKAAEAIFDYTAKEVIGKNISILVPEPHRSNHDKYIADFLRTGEGKIVGKGPREVTGLRKDGTEVPLDLGIGEMRTDTAHKFIASLRDITERKKAEEENQRYACILDSSVNEIYVYDAETYRYLQVNESARRNVGYSMDELRELRPWEINPNYNEATFKEVVAPLRNGAKDLLVFESVRKRKDGTTYPTEVHCQLLSDEDPPVYVSIIQDITERKLAEELSNRFGRILDSSLNEIYVIDAETRKFVHANDGALRNMDYTMDELRQLTPWDINKEIVEADFQAIVDPLLDGSKEEVVFESIRQRKDGTTYPIQVHSQFYANENPPLFVSVVVDITERKLAEEEILKLNRDLEKRVNERTRELAATNYDLRDTLENLEKAQDQLVEAEKMASLGGLVAGIAHEINTPVGIGVTAASHLEESVRDFREKYDKGDMKRSDLEQHLGLAEQSSAIVLSNLARASDLIRSFKQIAVDQSSEEERRFDLRGYLDEIVTSLRPNLKKAKHEIAIDCDEGLTVEIYPGAVSQIVTNLIMNAITHAYEDGQSGKMRIRAADSGDGTVALTFSDDGKGITKENLPRIFDPFFTTRRGSGGSGLGLNIVYNLVTQKLGGTITCSSEVGSGTAFDISFPKNVEDAHVGASEERRLAV